MSLQQQANQIKVEEQQKELQEQTIVNLRANWEKEKRDRKNDYRRSKRLLREHAAEIEVHQDKLKMLRLQIQRDKARAAFTAEQEEEDEENNSDMDTRDDETYQEDEQDNKTAMQPALAAGMRNQQSYMDEYLLTAFWIMGLGVSLENAGN